jgi:polysaccharide biosynthesis PFTS motif protein
MPFTSTAIIAANLGKPTIFYDPTNKIDNNDRAAHGIRVISDKVELENWIFENL